MRIHMKRTMTGTLVQLRARFATMKMDSTLSIAMKGSTGHQKQV